MPVQKETGRSVFAGLEGRIAFRSCNLAIEGEAGCSDGVTASSGIKGGRPGSSEAIRGLGSRRSSLGRLGCRETRLACAFDREGGGVRRARAAPLRSTGRAPRKVKQLQRLVGGAAGKQPSQPEDRLAV